MSRFAIFLSAGVLLSIAGHAGAQTPKIQKEIQKALDDARKDEPKDLSVEQLFQQALKHNPDLRVAEAKLREAEAELARMRMKVLADVATLNAEIEAAQTAYKEARNRLDTVRVLHEGKAASYEEFRSATLTTVKLKSELAVLQARLPYLLGKQSTGLILTLDVDALILKKWIDLSKDVAREPSDEEFLRRMTLDVLGRLPTVQEAQQFLKMPQKDRRILWIEEVRKKAGASGDVRVLDPREPRMRVQELWVEYIGNVRDSSTTDKLRKALEQPIQFQGTAIQHAELMKFVREKMPGVNLHVRVKTPKESALNITLAEPIPLGAFLQYLEDELNVVFVLRDYGVVVVGSDERLPPGALLVSDFWKRGKAKGTPPDPNEKK